VTSYLKSHGAHSISIHPTGELLTVKMSLLDLERAFHTTLSLFQHSSSSSLSPVLALRSLSSYSLPVSVGKHVTTVLGLIGFPPVRFTTFGVEEGGRRGKREREKERKGGRECIF
jgi:hypothetical protein